MGIYRLCGATTKKNILRLAFEESADIVDLSSMNVPDINVITSESVSQSVRISLAPSFILHTTGLQSGYIGRNTGNERN